MNMWRVVRLRKRENVLFLVAITDNHIRQDIPGAVAESYQAGTCG
jgi:hypothetical protein